MTKPAPTRPAALCSSITRSNYSWLNGKEAGPQCAGRPLLLRNFAGLKTRWLDWRLTARPARKPRTVEARRIVAIEIERYAVQAHGGAQPPGRSCGLMLLVTGLGLGAGVESSAVEAERHGSKMTGSVRRATGPRSPMACWRPVRACVLLAARRRPFPRLAEGGREISPHIAYQNAERRPPALV